MRKFVEIPMETINRLVEGKFVQGRLRRDPMTGQISFKEYVRVSRHRQNRIICQLENGWLKESPTRIKFYQSVKKKIGFRLVNLAMHRELVTAMDALEKEHILKSE